MLSLITRPSSQLLVRACAVKAAAGTTASSGVSPQLQPQQPVRHKYLAAKTDKRHDKPFYTRPRRKPVVDGVRSKAERLGYRGEPRLSKVELEELEEKLKEVTVFTGQQGLLFSTVAEELATERLERYMPRIAPNALSYLYSACQDVQQLEAVCLLHKRFRLSNGDQGGGAHSISHNAVVACLRLDRLDMALELLMDKLDYSVWPPAVTYSLLLDYTLAKYQENPDLLTEVYECAMIVQRDGVELTPTLASLCVTALSIQDSNDVGSEEGEAEDPYAPFTQPNLPGWEEWTVKESRELPAWAEKLETKHERLALAMYMAEKQHSAGVALYPVAYSYLISALGKLGKHEKLLQVLAWASSAGVSNSPLEELRGALSTASSNEEKIAMLAKINEEAAPASAEGEEEEEEKEGGTSSPPPSSPSVFDRLAIALPTKGPELEHTTDGLTEIPVMDGLSVDLAGEGLSGEKKMRRWGGWEPVTSAHVKNKVVKVKSMYKMPPKRFKASQSEFVDDS